MGSRGVRDTILPILPDEVMTTVNEFLGTQGLKKKKNHPILSSTCLVEFQKYSSCDPDSHYQDRRLDMSRLRKELLRIAWHR